MSGLNKKKKVLITEIIHPVLQEKLEDAGFECIHIEKITYKEVFDIIENYHGLVVRSKIKIDKAMIDKAIQLEFIGRYGSGMELIDTAYAKQKGVKCFNSPEGNKDAVAEQAVGMLLALLHRIRISDMELRNKQWNRIKHRGEELMGKTVGIIGFGNTGSAFAQRLQGFDVKILAYDKYKTGFGNTYVEEAKLQNLFDDADVLSLHIPLNEETKYWIDKNFVKRFKKSIYLLNLSRGEIVNTMDALDELEKGKLKGLLLDVFENESFNTFTTKDEEWFNRLILQQKVIITQHTGGLSHQSAYKLGAILADKSIQSIT